MIVGIPKEIKDNEQRVSLTPAGALELTKLGNTVFIEKNAGIGSGFSDKLYIDNGCNILNNSKEIFEKSEMIVKVKEPQENEITYLKKDQIMFTFFHFAASRKMTLEMIDTKSISIAYETVQNQNKSLPILVPMSEVAGRMAVQNGAKCLEGNMGGKGKLLGGVPGVKPSNVTIIGGGVVGTNAAKLAAGLGANVNILDKNIDRLRYLDEIMPSNVNTIYSNEYNLRSILEDTDLLIGAVLVVGSKAPKLITKDMLKLMSKGSVIVDVAVDQGGCVQTCKPTTHKNPTYNIDNIIHYCVSNMPGAVPHTSTIALTNVTLPYIKDLCKHSLKDIVDYNSELTKGFNIYKGKVTHKGVAESFNLDYHNINTLI